MSNEELNTEMKGESLDISEQKKRELAQLFPAVFTETINEKGELVSSVDFNKLKAELGEFTDVYENHRERYGMEWPGKKEALKLIQQPSRATLKPCREESVDFDNTENLFIEGDNLEVLKLLQKSYYGKVKMIYIDPPYNTGKEFIYPDKYSENLETYLAYAGLLDDEGKKFTTNTAAEGRFHTKWLNMMYPRLYLARNLLRNDGVIFISIDDNEIENVRRMCDEIFGEEAHIATFIWKSRQNIDNRTEHGASIDHEYVICYGKKVRGRERNTEQYTNPDGDARGDWASANMVGLATADRRPNLHYDLINAETKINYGCPEMGWRYDINTMKRLMDENRVLWPSSDGGRPRRKAFLNEISSEFTGFSSLIGKDLYTRNGTQDVQKLFGYRAMDFPKPVDLIYTLLEQGLEKGDVCLDFFAGSATTCEAIYKLNKNRGLKAKFIAIQLPEKCAETTEAYKAGLLTISKVAIERIRLSGVKIKTDTENQLDLAEKNNIDLGFKVLKLDQSNFKQWQSSLESTVDNVIEQLELHVDHITDSTSQEDILYELLLKSGFMPTEKIKTLELVGKKVFSIEDNELLICLEDDVTADLINAIVEIQPLQFICLDKAFHGNDQLKANTVQTFSSLNQGREKIDRIEFRTV